MWRANSYSVIGAGSARGALSRMFDLSDAEQADETFTILMGDKVEPRRDFIEKNAKYVQNLDV